MKFWRWGKNDQRQEKQQEPTFEPTKHRFPIIFSAEGRIPLLAHTAKHYLTVTVISRSDLTGAEDFTPSYKDVTQLPIAADVDVEIWQALLSKPYTHLFDFYYINNSGSHKTLLYFPLNCYVLYMEADLVAAQMGKFIMQSALMEKTPRPLLDGSEVRVFGYWLIAAFAAYKPMWERSRKMIGWGG